MLHLFRMQRLALLIAFAACGSVGPKYSGTVRVADTRLVAVNPDVKTLADSDKPVFFARGHYYLFEDGHWFVARSPSGPWTFDNKPPVPIAQIDQPFAYVHYKHDQQGREIETVATGTVSRAPEAQPAESPRDRQGATVDPSVDPATNIQR
jgi:hypothetical protein